MGNDEALKRGGSVFVCLLQCNITTKRYLIYTGIYYNTCWQSEASADRPYLD